MTISLSIGPQNRKSPFSSRHYRMDLRRRYLQPHVLRPVSAIGLGGDRLLTG